MLTLEGYAHFVLQDGLWAAWPPLLVLQLAG